MTFSTYKKLKQVLDTQGMRGLHEYTLKGNYLTRQTDDGPRRCYGLALYPENGAIYLLPDLMNVATKVKRFIPCYMSTRDGGHIYFC